MGLMFESKAVYVWASCVLPMSKALRKSPLSEKVVYNYKYKINVFWYSKYFLLCISMKDTQNCI